MSLHISEQLLQFLNALPVHGESQEKITAFREALRELLGDVDRISISLNMHCDIDDPENYRPDMRVTQYTPRRMRSADESVTVVRESETESAGLVEELRQQGFPVDLYHPPISFEYLFGAHAYLGAIVLWRELRHAPVSQATLDTMTALEPFLIYSLSDIVLRHKRTEPLVGVFDDALEQLTGEAGLSKTEVRVVVLLLLGHSYKDMADMLVVSMDTVKYHLKTIYRKTGTRSGSELFAKYFTPRLDLPSTE